MSRSPTKILKAFNSPNEVKNFLIRIDISEFTLL